MKTTLLTLFAGLLGLTVGHAQILNSSFENWEQDGANCMSPENWGTINGSTSIVSICTASQETSSVHTGSSALKLTTEHIVIFPIVDQIAPGICTSGTVNTQTEAVEGGHAFTDRPTSFTGWYTAGPVNNDEYSFSVSLINENIGQTVGTAEWAGNTAVGTFTQFTAPVTYTLPDNPTIVQIILLPSDETNPQEGSWVIFDDIEAQSTTVGIADAEAEMIKTYPNPVVSDVFFNLGNLDRANVTIYNMLGVKVAERSLSASNNSLSLTSFNNGAYVWQLTKLNGELVKTGKLILTK